ncbi:PhzF family phenazine biosynthesis protein [Pseudorhodoplanes sinuspersici]|uniref:Phenazine biosynthesis protein PhzF n=1 Tax=Pseudorhodoplanes sinuspersici TaxID=1235591 RepID=A0A1W6ZS27_9HYPH|nr:PhzF family phenazine biosynthesis protein [Pseudorhodoplanes sinuspersici]ARQ00197.1 phenazine biosynthesis protein PhzF [Pseudorhodoplanes sinuspersici]
MRRRFVTLDVFTENRFTGNPLAVVLESDGLEKSDMQAIAREFNLAETVFVMQPANERHRALLRIFTPQTELPFAGHPTVGTAVLLGCMSGYNLGAHDLVLEETVGLVHCTVEPKGREHGHASFVLPRLPEKLEGAPSGEAAMAALGLNASDIGFGEPSAWSAGVAVNFIPVRDLESIARATPDASHFDGAFGKNGRSVAYLFCGETSDHAHHFHARMFAPKLGIREDPATGAAVAAFAGLIAETTRPEDGSHRFVIEQGYEMGRPSQIELGMTIESGALTRATIGGSAIIVSDGHLEA